MKLPQLDAKKKRALAIGAGAIVVVLALIARNRAGLKGDPSIGVAVPDPAAADGYPGSFDTGSYDTGMAGGPGAAGGTAVDTSWDDLLNGINGLQDAVWSQGDTIAGLTNGGGGSGGGELLSGNVVPLGPPIVPATNAAARTPTAKAATKAAAKPASGVASRMVQTLRSPSAPPTATRHTTPAVPHVMAGPSGAIAAPTLTPGWGPPVAARTPSQQPAVGVQVMGGVGAIAKPKATAGWGLGH